MPERQTRVGGKFGSNHTTYIQAAAIVADIAAKCPVVKKIRPGIIASSRGKSGTRRHVKIIDATQGILLSVTDGAAHQEVTVCISNIHEAKYYIACGARDAGITISFGKTT